jgi:hypothetical protein
VHRTAADPAPTRRRLTSSIACLALAAGAALCAPAQGAAHAAPSSVAADGLARVRSLGPGLEGAQARVLGGDQRIWLKVDPARSVLVLGYVDEPFLRFSEAGVAVNRRSPTARVAGALSAPPDASAGTPVWRPLTAAHEYAWHDHRLRPSGGAAGGGTRAWSIPVVVDGQRSSIAGEARYEPPPALWPWLVPLGVAVAGVGLLLRRRHAATAAAATHALAVCALAGGLTSFVGRSLGQEGGPVGRWLGAGAAVALGVLLVAGLAWRWSGRRPAAIVAGVIGASEGLAMLAVFRHGLVLSALPVEVARAAAALGLLAGAATVVLAVAAAGWGRPGVIARRGAPSRTPRGAARPAGASAAGRRGRGA